MRYWPEPAGRILAELRGLGLWGVDRPPLPLLGTPVEWGGMAGKSETAPWGGVAAVRPPGSGVASAGSGRRRLRAPLVLLCLLLPALAHGDEPSDLAVQAHEVHSRWCSETEQAEYTQAAEAVGQVTPVWVSVSRTYDATGVEYLRFWRAMLGLCIGQGERAEEDLRAFILASELDPQLIPLVEEARRRLRLMGARVPPVRRPPRARPARAEPKRARSSSSPGVNADQAAAPRLQVGLSGGYQRVQVFDYGAIGLALAGRLVGPLHIDGGVAVSLGDLWRDASNAPVEPPMRSLLLVARVGVLLQFVGPVEPRVGLSLAVAGNPNGSVGAAVLAGPLLHGGVDILLPGSPLALRIAGEVGYLVPLPMAGATGGITLRF